MNSTYKKHAPISFVIILSLFLLTICTKEAQAETGCTLIISYPTRDIIKEEGDCQKQRSPASTFKIPLAVMGFDTGILVNKNTPTWPYKDTYQSTLEFQKKTTNPGIWMQDSIVWFSQKLTQKMGEEKFSHYIKLLDYGNMDVSGNPGKNDGLTRAWLFSSLAISPKEQVHFLADLMSLNLPVSKQAQKQTINLIPQFSAGKWDVFGKTGSGWLRYPSGEYNKNKPQGWFIGWARYQDQTLIFAKLVIENRPSDEFAGPKARAQFLEELSRM